MAKQKIRSPLRRIGGARPGYRRATYYMTPDLIRRLKIRAAEVGRDQSGIVREAVETFLGK